MLGLIFYNIGLGARIQEVPKNENITHGIWSILPNLKKTLQLLPLFLNNTRAHNFQHLHEFRKNLATKTDYPPYCFLFKVLCGPFILCNYWVVIVPTDQGNISLEWEEQVSGLYLRVWLFFSFILTYTLSFSWYGEIIFYSKRLSDNVGELAHLRHHILCFSKCY